MTTAVGFLPEETIASALRAGRDAAERLIGLGLIAGAALALQGRWEIVGRADRLGVLD